MLIKVIGRNFKGRGGCGHLIRKGETYYIINEPSRLTATCDSCVKKMFGTRPVVSQVVKADELINWPKN